MSGVVDSEISALKSRSVPSSRYKQTEVGTIPEDWTVRKLGAVSHVQSGVAKNAANTPVDPVVVHYLRVANVQDGYLDLREMSQITVSRSDLQRYCVVAGDVLMNEGGDLDQLGRGAIWRGEFNPCIHQNHVFVVRCGKEVTPEFLNTWSSGSPARRFFMILGKQTTNLASISKTSLELLPIAVPSLAEQLAITTALSDVDALLGALDRLIAKKRDLKQAAMQQLLTGQTRLPGFPEWDVMPFGQLYAESSRNGVYKTAEFQGRGTRVVNMGEMFGFDFISDQEMNRVSLTSQELATSGLRDGDLLFGRRSVVHSGAGKCSIVLNPPEALIFESSIIRVRLNRDIADPLFYYYFFASSIGRLLMSVIISGTNVKGIRGSELRDLEIPHPSLPEQIAIAEVLSDMDTEIAALGQRRDKTRALKQGMMQELLTGKTRLVTPSGTTG